MVSNQHHLYSSQHSSLYNSNSQWICLQASTSQELTSHSNKTCNKTFNNSKTNSSSKRRKVMRLVLGSLISIHLRRSISKNKSKLQPLALWAVKRSTPRPACFIQAPMTHLTVFGVHSRTSHRWIWQEGSSRSSPTTRCLTQEWVCKWANPAWASQVWTWARWALSQVWECNRKWANLLWLWVTPVWCNNLETWETWEDKWDKWEWCRDSKTWAIHLSSSLRWQAWIIRCSASNSNSPIWEWICQGNSVNSQTMPTCSAKWTTWVVSNSSRNLLLASASCEKTKTCLVALRPLC